MGKPKKIEAAKVSENYDWGDFGSANASGVNLSPMASQSVRDAQSGINQYLNELINPSYGNESFKARQDLIDTNMRQAANQYAANAISRGARGSATNAILNSLAANRNTQLRQAMTEEDARLRNVLGSLQGVEGNYFNMGNTMAQNILNRVTANQSAQQQANIANTQAENQWRNNLISAGAGIAGMALGGGLGSGALAGLFGNNLVKDVNGNVLGKVGGYGTYTGA